MQSVSSSYMDVVGWFGRVVVGGHCLCTLMVVLRLYRCDIDQLNYWLILVTNLGDFVLCMYMNIWNILKPQLAF